MLLADQSTGLLRLFARMKISTKGRYALNALVDIALNDNCKPVSLSDIASRQQVSLNYLEQLFVKLRRNNVVVSVRGANGGYKLAKSSEKIRLSEILGAVDENVNALHIGRGAQISEKTSEAKELADKFWEQLSSTVFLSLHQTRLIDLIDGSIFPCKAVPDFVQFVDE